MNWTAIGLAAISGFLSGAVAAAKIDHEAYKAHPDPVFDWGLAAKRWLRGGALGAIAAVGALFGIRPELAGVTA